MKKIIFLVGARPQIIKFAALLPEVERNQLNYILVHSGQHYDRILSGVFFEELKIPAPHYNLRAGSGSHASQIAEIVSRLYRVILKEQPDFGVVFGDTNTTLAGSILFSHIHLPFAHVEAGLRSYRKDMPEEINRVITDRLANILFAPSMLAVENLKREGITQNVHNVGDLHFDLYLRVKDKINMAAADKITKKDFVFLTVHREENTRSPDFIRKLLLSLDKEGINCVFPAHPRTQKLIKGLNLDHISIVQPLPYLKTLSLIKKAQLVITDSGGLQKEAYFLKKRTIILRKETEWEEIIRSGFGKLAGNDITTILNLIKEPWEPGEYRNYYGNGKSAEKIVKILKEI